MENRIYHAGKIIIPAILIVLTSFSYAASKKPVTVILIGKMNNKYEIHMKLTIEAAKVKGSYYYSSSFKPIDLEGTRSGNTITLNEKVNDTITGTFKGKMLNNLYKGDWSNTSGKELSFSLINKEWIAEDADNISGTYSLGMSKEEAKGAAIPKGEKGYGGKATVMLFSNKKIGFCISYTKGYPGYHIGEIQGTASPSADGVYTYSESLNTGDKPCQLAFTFKNKKLELLQSSDDGSCGFGAFVNISGTYKKEGKAVNLENCLY